jgi:hypothetical protein
MILVVHLVASPAVNKLKTVGNQQDNYMLTKESGAQKRTSNFVYFDLITVTYFGSKI